MRVATKGNALYDYAFDTMPLTLRIINGAGQALGVQPMRSFDENGGTVGRANGNDWVLPDPERHLSDRLPADPR